MKQKIPLMYLFTYQRLKDKSRGGILQKEKFSEIICRLNHVTKKYVQPVLEEFEVMKLIDPINKNEIKILSLKSKKGLGRSYGY